MATRFRKRPVVVDAQQWAALEGTQDLVDWVDAIAGEGVLVYDSDVAGPSGASGEDWGELRVTTLEGTHIATPGDWLIRGLQGEFYFCKPDVFAATYEPA